MGARPVTVAVDAACWWNDRGYGRFTRELVSALAARDTGFRYVLVADRDPDDCFPSGVEVARAATRRATSEVAVGAGARSPADLWAAGRALARVGADLVFFPAVYSYAPVPRRGPCVVTFHDAIPERFPQLVFPTRRNRWLWRAKVALALRQATRVLTVSQASARDLETVLGVPRARIDLVSEAADPRFRPLGEAAVREARRRWGLGDRRYLVYVGGLNPHKNLLGLLRAGVDLAKEFDDLAVAIVGDTSGRGFHDNLAELRAFLAGQPDLAARVVFTGYVPDDELVALYSGAWAFVSPSLAEGFGLPALEAMACGLPVLASDRGSLPEVVGEAGCFFDPDSPAAIAEATARLLRDPARREVLARAARRRAAAFSWERAAGEAEVCFRRALGASG